jgi:hypothetical protein
MHAFEDLESVHSALSRLEKREPPLVTILPRQPGTKEARYAHLLGDSPPVAPSAPPHATAARDHEAAAPSNDRVEGLAAEVAELRSQIADLQSQFATFRKQFE